MNLKYERTFTVSVPVQRAWRAFTDPQEIRAWFTPRTVATEARAGENVTFDVAGVTQFEINVNEIQPERLLRYTQGPGVTPGATEVTVIFEAVEGGTRITITQEGFGEGAEWLESLQGLTMGVNESITELILYLETGVSFPRHGPGNSVLGFAALDEPLGLRLYEVRAGTFAEEVGLIPGDILLQVGRCPVFDRRDVAVFTRDHEPGEEVEVFWARNGEVTRGTARLSDRRSLVVADAAVERSALRWL